MQKNPTNSLPKLRKVALPLDLTGPHVTPGASSQDRLYQALRHTRGLRCDPDQIMLTSGTQHGLRIVLSAILRAQDQIWCEDPGYPAARKAIEHYGGRPVAVPVDDFGLVVAKGRAAAPSARAAYVTPSHQFPLGTCMSLARRLSLLQAARASKSWIVEDDYDAEFRYTSSPQPSLQSLDEHRRVIYIGSFSKTLFPALRLGYVVLPPELVDKFAELKSVVDDYGPLIDQATLSSFLESGAFYAHLRRCRRHYAERQSLFLEQVARYGLPLTFPITGRGMNLAGLLPEGSSDRIWSNRLKAAGLDVPPLSSYAINPTPPGLLFGLAAFDARSIQRGVAKMAQTFDQRGTS